MMHDQIQRSVQAFAYTDGLTRDAAIVCAAVLVFLLAAAWIVTVYRARAGITVAATARTVLLLGVAYVLAKALGHVISDPRPYVVQHIQPLIPLAHDNGFPSDHALLAWALALSLCWLAPAAVAPFAVGAVLVMFGRLGVAAHHTLDVAGSALIVAAVALLLTLLPLPARWERPLFAHPAWPGFLRVP
jgi:membrane-associated phospholipid phosphatase